MQIEHEPIALSLLGRMFEQAPGFRAIVQGPEHRFVLANPAFVRMVGDRDLIGATVAEVLPEAVGQGYRDRLDQVYASNTAYTSTAAEFAVQLQPGDPVSICYVDFVCQPITDAAGRVEGILIDGYDVTDRVAGARREAFRVELQDRLRGLDDPREVIARTTQSLCDFLDTNRVAYAEIGPDDDSVVIDRAWNACDTTGTGRRYTLADFDGPFIDALWQGRTVAIMDVARDALTASARAAFERVGICALLDVPVIRSGRLVAILAIHNATSRAWSAEEIALAEELAGDTRAAAQHVRADASLRDAEERYLALFNAIDQGFCTIEVAFDANDLPTDYRFLEVSPSFELQTGIKDGAGRWMRDIAADQFWFDTYGRVARTGEPARFEASSTPLQRWWDVYAFRISGPRRIAVLFRDITDSKRAQTALRESEERFRSLAEGVPVHVWRSADLGDWTWSSPQWQSFAGQSLSDSVGMGWLEAVHPDDRAAVMTAWVNAKRNGGLDLDHRLRRSVDGDYIWHQTRSTPIRDEHGAILEWVGTTTDIHQLKGLQERQNILVAELQHRTRNLIAIVRSVSDKTVAGSTTLEDFQIRFRARLEALSRVRGLLSRSTDNGTTFDDLVGAELQAHLDEGNAGQVAMQGPTGISVRSTTVQTLALAIHELATNAVKYGALSTPDGRLSVSWDVARPEGAPPRLTVTWRESGVALATVDRTKCGYGRELIERALPYQLSADTDYRFGPDGVLCTIAMPLPEDRLERTEMAAG